MEEEYFKQVGEHLADAQLSQMFGSPCLKVNGKAFACLHNDEMVFKLKGEYHTEALRLSGSKLFDPSGKMPMKEWVQVPFEHKELWPKFAESALDYVSTLKK